MALADTPLPPLPFGADTAKTFHDARTLGDALAPFVGGLEAVEAAGSAPASHSRISGVVVGDVALMACATTPGHAVVGGNDQLVFGFVHSGEASYAIETGTFRGVREDRVFVADSCPRTVATDRETVLVVMVVDRQRLLRTAHTMAGGDAAADRSRGGADSLLPRPGSLMPVFNRRLASGRVLGGIFGTIDAVNGDGSALAALALDDQIHRLLALMLAPEQFVSGAARGGGTRGAEATVARACEFIEAHLTSPITLTHLEKVTGLGHRALQLAFQARLQCSPLEWVLRRRLERARFALLSGAEGESVREVARRHGFLQAGHFARLYRREFGELPSQTLARRRG